MKHLPVVLLVAVFACRSTQHRQQNLNSLNNAGSLTLKMAEVSIDDQPMAALMLCQRSNCQNVLRDKDGEDYFYFHNLAGIYNEKVAKEDRGNKVRMILLGLTSAATLAATVFYIRSDILRQKIGKYSKKYIEGLEKTLDKIKKRGNDLSNQDKLEIQKADEAALDFKGKIDEMEKKDKKLYHIYYGAFAATGAFATSMILPGIAEDSIWKENKRTLSKLFVHGEAIKVTRDELRDLIDVLIRHVPATIDSTVEHFIYGQ